MDSFIMFLHWSLMFLYPVNIVAISYKAFVASKFFNIPATELLVSFFVIYNNSDRNMYGSRRLKKYMVFSNTINIVLYFSIMLSLFMLVIFGGGILWY